MDAAPVAAAGPAPAPAQASAAERAPGSRDAAPRRVAVIGAGPAGLMAAEALAGAGLQVDVFDAMPSVGRKFLLAGKGGLNLTHSEPLEAFRDRYAERAPQVARWLQALPPQALRDWAHGLGIETFVGSSGRVFPRDMKAAPLLRAWLHRLRGAGVRFHMRHRWQGAWDAIEPLASGTAPGPGALRFDTPQGEHRHPADAVLLALGGASWPRLGSDAAWVPWLVARGIDLAPLRPANCGFDVGWSDFVRERHAGAPIKPVRLRLPGPPGADAAFDRQGEFVLTEHGIEGSLVYAASALLREAIAREGVVTVELDLLPARTADQVAAALALPRGSRSLAKQLKARLGIEGAKLALLHELLPGDALHDPTRLAAGLKALPLSLRAARPVAEAISTAGGVRLEAVDDGLMLRAWPGVFCAGEMLDWEAPTGGYLLTACMASGVVAAQGVRRWCGRP